MTWSRKLSQFVLCGYPIPRCWTVVTTMSRTTLQLSTGCIYHNVLTSRWLSWRFGCYMVSSHHTWISWIMSPTCPVIADFGNQLLVPVFRLTTVGWRTFPVTASLVWVYGTIQMLLVLLLLLLLEWDCWAKWCKTNNLLLHKTKYK